EQIAGSGELLLVLGAAIRAAGAIRVEARIPYADAPDHSVELDIDPVILVVRPIGHVHRGDGDVVVKRVGEAGELHDAARVGIVREVAVVVAGQRSGLPGTATGGRRRRRAS